VRKIGWATTTEWRAILPLNRFSFGQGCSLFPFFNPASPPTGLRIRCPSEGRLGALKCLAHEMGGGRLVVTEVLVERTGIVSLYAGVKDHVRQSMAPSPGFHRSH